MGLASESCWPAVESLVPSSGHGQLYKPVDISSAAGEEGLPFPFADIPALVHDHSYLPVRFDGLEDNALVYISGFVNDTGSEEAVLCCLPCQPGDRRCIWHQGPELPPAVSKKQWMPGDPHQRAQ